MKWTQKLGQKISISQGVPNSGTDDSQAASNSTGVRYPHEKFPKSRFSTQPTVGSGLKIIIPDDLDLSGVDNSMAKSNKI